MRSLFLSYRSLSSSSDDDDELYDSFLAAPAAADRLPVGLADCPGPGWLVGGGRLAWSAAGPKPARCSIILSMSSSSRSRREPASWSSLYWVSRSAHG